MNEHGPVLLVVIALVGVVTVGGAIAMSEGSVGIGLTIGPTDVDANSTDPPTPTPTQRPISVTAVVEAGPAGEDGSFTISASLYNPRAHDVTETVAIRVDGDGDDVFETTLGRETVTIPSGTVTSIETSVSSGRFSAGSYPFVVGRASGEGHWTTGVVELSPPTFSVTAVRGDPTVRGEHATVNASVRNLGDFGGHRTLVLHVDRDRDGQFTTSERVVETAPTLPARGSGTVTMTVPTGDLEPGSYPVRVATDDDRLEGSLVVLRPATFEVSATEVPVAVVRGENLTLTARVSNVGDVAGERLVRVGFDLDGDGALSTNETGTSTALELGAGTNGTATFTLSTDTLARGNATVMVATEAMAAGRTVAVLRPATFNVSHVSAPTGVARGSPFTVNATVTNAGDVAGNATVTLEGPNGSTADGREVSLPAGGSTSVELSIGTANLTRGNYTTVLLTPDDRVEQPFRVRDGYFELSRLRGDDTLTFGAPIEFSAVVSNTGDASDTQRLELLIDLDGDDVPESHNISTLVTLGAGERTTVSLGLDTPGAELSATDSALVGTHIFGIFSEDTNATDVFAVKRPSGGGGGTGSSTDESAERATLDEISQAKYGLEYEALSGETRTQVDELYERQPFADGRVITEVLTREEIAAERYGVDGELSFNFTALDIELQQQIEAEFDAQFESETGDRVESWDELARAEYGAPYDDLTTAQQEAIREAYWEQFDE